ncbi:MAG: hypothetical protein M5U28_12980 [Sandaracinaceae bacterium]|nr:hypothetical protein [Sandaracinaceae bacterium]
MGARRVPPGGAGRGGRGARGRHHRAGRRNRRAGSLAADTLVYEPASDTWRTGAPIPTPREHLAGVEVDGELWALAGRRNSLSSNTNVVEIYDPIADAWREGPAMPSARGGFDAAILAGAIYAVGGEQLDRALDSVDRFEVEAGAWSAAPPVPTAAPRARRGRARRAALGGRRRRSTRVRSGGRGRVLHALTPPPPGRARTPAAAPAPIAGARGAERRVRSGREAELPALERERFTVEYPYFL